MRVASLKSFEQIGQRLAAALQDVAGSAIPLSLQPDLHSIMQERGLLYPDVIQSISMNFLNDIGRR